MKLKRIRDKNRGCKVENCDKPHNCKGYCRTHYMRFQRYGAPRLKYRPDPEERFWKYVDKNGPVHPVLGTACWLWTATRSQGYGRLSINGKDQRAHRYSYFLADGQWPKHLACHHCDNPPCVNPSHLFDGTHQDNARDCVAKGRHPLLGGPGRRPGSGGGGGRRPSTHCKNGHERTIENTIKHGKKGRLCGPCSRAYFRNWYRKNRQARSSVDVQLT